MTSPLGDMKTQIGNIEVDKRPRWTGKQKYLFSGKKTTFLCSLRRIDSVPI